MYKKGNYGLESSKKKKSSHINNQTPNGATSSEVFHSINCVVKQNSSRTPFTLQNFINPHRAQNLIDN